MMLKNYTILIVDDEEGMRDSLHKLLSRDGYQLITASNGLQALQELQNNQVDLVLLDIMMPGIDGLETLKKIKVIKPETLVIMITGYGTIESAVTAMKYGAKDYITKPFTVQNLRNVLEECFESLEANREKDLLHQPRTAFGEIIGESPAMKRVIATLSKVVETDATVLILGESGTGKELFAKAIHYYGPRKEKPFVSLNCAAIPESLLESELFGYEKGAFTGAVSQHIGLFEQAEGGTLFLDEIGDMALSTQAKILRVLEERELTRIGGTTPIKINVRIVAATNKNLLEAVNEGTFREDLYYRLNVVPITLPPLRERLEDLSLLVKHFLLKYGADYNKPIKTISPALLKSFKEYQWPGNVRELRNIIERLVVLGEQDFNFKDYIIEANQVLQETVADQILPLNKLKGMQDKEECAMIAAALEKARWNKKRAAELLKISRKSLYDKMAKYNLN